ncbi:MAG: site-specific DNA-methyltransferase [Oscillospiraceae bacterium]|nr:site-specific DNA-methyltransferase [Oscillospiraceae bacterium]
MIKLMQGDCLKQMEKIPNHSIDMLLTDPPYSSGGLFSGQRKTSTSTKYFGAAACPDFTGDNRDQLSFLYWETLWISKAMEKLKFGAIACIFTDWRQISATINALQCGGLIFRGIVVWDKGNSRNIPHRFRNDCEYIVWGTKGNRSIKVQDELHVYPGCYHIKGMNTRKKHHQTEKPTELLEKLIQISPEDGTVLDCFMGSDSTGVACLNTNRDFIGIELGKNYFEIAEQRIQEAEQKKAGIY